MIQVKKHIDTAPYHYEVTDTATGVYLFLTDEEAASLRDQLNAALPVHGAKLDEEEP